MSWMDELRRLLRRARREERTEGMEGGISCHEAAERIFEWLDGELDPETERSVGTHLETCARCYPRLVFERAFREALARVAEDESAPEELRDRIVRALEEEGFGPS
jgi:mycothiol system anti-sigma-R factor